MGCIDGPKGCEGEVFEEPSMSGATTSERCRKHRAEYEERVGPKVREIERRYPKHAPADFDPTYAGERWEEDY